ncbi:Hpt domain-containing protein [Pedobacter xixiisoli]|uniref:HPt (Histidine-containing phosphotransfer) domain-containing protein n=1 Tax=Pedobacter xixiisoli TaxID=1476464 RepID=A0A285ZP07_9SPHI|nr:Hpt domain-containing protein [Pedobacter xixiisoli]SOD11411.1 HPt (histidine-containing phosphotransfer) domain-containing protein [Pedobacter xixiisoli]
MINPAKSNEDLDLSYLREMSGDSAEFMIEMLDTLVEQIPIYLEDLQKAVDAKDWKAASEFAHKVKPTFYYVGREDIRDYVQVIERNAKEGIDVEKIPAALVEIKQELNIILTQVAKSKTELEAQL